MSLSSSSLASYQNIVRAARHALDFSAHRLRRAACLISEDLLRFACEFLVEVLYSAIPLPFTSWQQCLDRHEALFVRVSPTFVSGSHFITLPRTILSWLVLNKG